MKFISKLLALFAIGMMATACEDKINEENVSLSVTTPQVSGIQPNSAVISATASGSHLIARGICYATTPNPTINDNKVLAIGKDMVLTISGLTKATTYYVRGFVQTSFDVRYSEEVSFTTLTEESAEDDPQTEGPSALKRVSVHDPSIVWDPSTSTYYVFGSHRAAARSNNLMTWQAFTAPWATATSTKPVRRSKPLSLIFVPMRSLPKPI